MFAEPAFAALLAVVGFALLNWPFVELARSAGGAALFIYWFGLWAALVVFAGLLGWAAAHRDGGDV